MDAGKYRYNTPWDLRLRTIGVWPYFALYGVLALLSLGLEVPAPFHSPLLDRTGFAGPAIWAFFGAYPAFHVLMKPRLLCTYAGPVAQATGFFVGFFIAGVVVLSLLAGLPENLSRRAQRMLLNPASSAGLLVMASVTLSLGMFLILEPLREHATHLLAGVGRRRC